MVPMEQGPMGQGPMGHNDQHLHHNLEHNDLLQQEIQEEEEQQQQQEETMSMASSWNKMNTPRSARCVGRQGSEEAEESHSRKQQP
jgi:DNA-directed RNA polymerase beta' subunit